MVILKKEKKKESTAFIPNYYMHQVFCLMYVDKEISLSSPLLDGRAFFFFLNKMIDNLLMKREDTRN
jgi:hypothetical protein